MKYGIHKVQFERSFGLFKLNNLLIPKIINLKELVLMRHSVLHYYIGGLYPNPELPVFSNIDSGSVFNINKFVNDDIPNVKKRTINDKKIFKKLRRSSVVYKTLNPLKFDWPFRNNASELKTSSYILNYSHIESGYRIIDRKETPHTLFDETIKTIAEEIKLANSKSNTPLEHYIIQPLPRILPTISNYIKFNSKFGETVYFKNLKTKEEMMVSHILLAMYKEGFDKSVFRHFKKLGNVSFIFTRGTAGLIINIEKLLSFSEEYGNIEGDRQVTPLRLNKLFHRSLASMYGTDGYLASEIEDGVYKEIGVKTLTDTLGIKELGSVDDESEETSVIEKIVSGDIDENTIDEISSSLEVIDKESNNSEILHDVSTDTIMSSKHSIEDTVTDKLVEVIRLNEFDKSKTKKLEQAHENYMVSKNPYDKTKTIRQSIKFKKEDMEIDKKDVKIPSLNTILSPTHNSKLTTGRNKLYIKNLFKKHIVSTVASLSKTGMVVKSHEVEETNYILGDFELHSVQISDPVRGTTNTLKFKIPKIDEEGKFKISGNEYLLKSMKIDTPIKKTAPTRVMLNSGYGKIFVDKARLKKDDRGFSIRNELIDLQTDGKIKLLTLGSSKVFNEQLPVVYGQFLRYVKSFKIVNRDMNLKFNFSFKERHTISNDVSKAEKKGLVVCGLDERNNLLLVMDDDGMVSTYDKGIYKELGTVFDLAKIDIKKLKPEFTTVNVFKFKLPVGIAMLYYVGLKNLVRLTKVEIIKSSSRTDENKDKEGIFIKFSDGSIKVTPKDRMSVLVWEGVASYQKYFRKESIDIIDDRSKMEPFFSEIGMTILQINELKLLSDMFVDPVTGTLLEQMGEPTTFEGLLIRASEMLIDDNYKHPNSFENFLVRGYERVPLIVYNTFVTAMRNKRNAEYFGRSKLDYNPFEVWNIINTDSSKISVDDLNPLAELKLKEEVTSTGFGGRTRETMSKQTREVRPEDIGIVSEAVKDNSDVGISNTLPAVPMIDDLIGNTTTNGENLEMVNILSTPAMLAPFTTQDDIKRTNFVSIMASHFVPTEGTRVFPVRTGYESFVPYKFSEKFVKFSEDDGKVIKVTPNNITIKYKDEEIKYPYKDWLGKEVSGSSFKHIMVSDLKEGSKISNGDVIYYDQAFFEPDFFNPTKVVYKNSNIATVAIMETNETNEDGSLLSSTLTNRTAVSSVKSVSIVITNEDGVSNFKTVGEKVGFNSLLLSIDSELTDTKEFSKETKDLLEAFIRTTPKSDTEGKIVKIRAYYNCEEKEMTESLKKFLDGLNKDDVAKVGSDYSINGIPLQYGSIEIKYFIENKAVMVTGDKAVFSNQLKSTASEIINHPLKTEGGVNIDAVFGGRAIADRIVNSPYLIGSTARILREIGRLAVEKYDS